METKINLNDQNVFKKFCDFFRAENGCDWNDGKIAMMYTNDDVLKFMASLVNDTNSDPRIEFVEFNGEKYPYRMVYHKEAGRDVIIGCGTLDRSLFDDEDGGYVNEEASRVDDMFYGFVEDCAILYMNDNDLERYVNEVLD
jgi:hypothetical protein